jgi:cytochrome oxidase Cu insertion factor (SCO1/SenC/PrrC family)
MKKHTAVIFCVVALVASLALSCSSADEDRTDTGSGTGAIHNAELKVGDKAPEFDLYDSTGTKIRLSDYLGKKNVVLAFYPAAWTPV